MAGWRQTSRRRQTRKPTCKRTTQTQPTCKWICRTILSWFALENICLPCLESKPQHVFPLHGVAFVKAEGRLTCRGRLAGRDRHTGRQAWVSRRVPCLHVGADWNSDVDKHKHNVLEHIQPQGSGLAELGKDRYRESSYIMGAKLKYYYDENHLKHTCHAQGPTGKNIVEQPKIQCCTKPFPKKSNLKNKDISVFNIEESAKLSV